MTPPRHSSALIAGGRTPRSSPRGCQGGSARRRGRKIPPLYARVAAERPRRPPPALPALERAIEPAKPAGARCCRARAGAFGKMTIAGPCRSPPRWRAIIAAAPLSRPPDRRDVAIAHKPSPSVNNELALEHDRSWSSISIISSVSNTDWADRDRTRRAAVLIDQGRFQKAGGAARERIQPCAQARIAGCRQADPEGIRTRRRPSMRSTEQSRPQRRPRYRSGRRRGRAGSYCIRGRWP